MSSSEETAKLFRVWKTALEMLRDRGFLVLDSEIKMSRLEFLDKFGENFKREDLDMLKTKEDDPNDRIFVFFPNEPKLNVSVTRRYAERMRSEKIFRGIIVVQEVPTPHAKHAIEDLSQKYYLEVFLDAELLVNVNNHMLVPKHEVLSNEEKKELLKRYTVKETQLPKMMSNDPIAKYLGIRRGQVVKITRKSETAGIYITYRISDPMLLRAVVRRMPEQSPEICATLLRWLPQRQQARWASGGFPRGRPRPTKPGFAGGEGKSEWWVVDGEMHEIGDHVPHRERFAMRGRR
ncbi:DNA-directed RNA polymerases II and IV subunit 5A-like [Phalaenopsis equestris]|uniref:DNA-directed RNA polymerases II and IV subunit 5A-like n=1 Tax=Phalaenopsis equestris TaxID=78828 RepID=UPI0009E3647E|nr:DNA-directed RNA polymerases II and IV subunit 5A-like [Phalaenopsis equestris]